MIDIEQLNKDLPAMSVSAIGQAIKTDWKKVNFAAAPYLNAMLSLHSIHDDYGADTGKSVVAYFLANAGTWRGDVARAVKKELNKRLK